ncbi:MAG: lysozyme [Pseudomonadota bacterium]
MISYTSEGGFNLIKKFEGFMGAPYTCAGGKKTIGYGHVMLDGEEWQTISEESAEEILRQDLCISEQAVLRNINVSLCQNQFDALVSLTFNIGSAALQRSTLRQKINVNAATDEITHEFMRWVYAGGRALAGLAKRRCEEARLYSQN